MDDLRFLFADESLGQRVYHTIICRSERKLFLYDPSVHACDIIVNGTRDGRARHEYFSSVNIDK